MACSSRNVVLLPMALLLGSSPAMAERVGVMVLDASGSMWNRMEGDITRIEVARDVIEEYLRDRDPEVPLSVLAYGHSRRGDCGDIEIVATMQRQDATPLADQIRGLNPQGMTPIAESLRLAAEQIPRTAEAADIILVTDGLETCDGDPCAEAARLAEQGLAIRAHVVGFGLADSEIQQLSCVTEQTGGELLQTHSGTELASALARVEEVAAEAEPEPEPEPEPLPDEATLNAPADIPAGSEFEVSWEGPDDSRDYITIVPAGAPEDAYESYQRTSRGSPLSLTAPDALGEHEVRYVHNATEEVLASQPVTLTPVSAEVQAPEEIPAGSEFEVDWEGPDNPRDYVTLVPAGAPEDAYESYQRTSRGSPLALEAPEAPGDYEVRYVVQQSRRVLASEPVSVGAGEVAMSVIGTPEPNGVLEVEWQGPGRYADLIQVVPPDSPDDVEPIREARASQGSPLQLFAPPAAGEYELRYKASDSGEILERISFRLE